MSKEKLKNRGITLITLIITVIVMLILTGVTLSVTIGDNGLVNKAKEAKESTQIAMDKEMLLSAVIGAIGIDGKVNFSTIVLPEGFSGSNGIYTSKNGYTFTVNENGKITYNGEFSEEGDGVFGEEDDPVDEEDDPLAFKWKSVNLDVDTNTEYVNFDVVLNFTAEGNVILSTRGKNIATIDATDQSNIDPETNNLSFDLELESTVNAELTMANDNDVNLTLAASEVYTCKKTIIDHETVFSNDEVLKALGIANNLGTYRGTWTKIGTENGNAKLVSTMLVSNYTLGYEDPKAIAAVSIAGTEPTAEEKLQRSIWSYQNVESTLTEVVQENTGIASARSVNLEDIKEYSGMTEPDKTEGRYDQPYTYNYANHKDQIFITENGTIEKLDVLDETVTIRYTYFYKTYPKGNIDLFTSGAFWLASPCVCCYSDNAEFRVRYANRECIETYKYLFNSKGEVDNRSDGVRAIVVVPGL